MTQAIHKWLAPLLVGLLVAGFAVGEYFDGFANFNAMGGDILLRWHVRERQPPADILLVDIDQASLDDPQMLELAGNWPWPRAVHGELTRFLAAQKPAVIAFDIIFSEPDVFRPASDAVLSEAVVATKAILPLVIAADGMPTPLRNLPPIMEIRPGKDADPEAGLPLIAPKAIDPAGWRTGLINFLPDADRVGRRYWVNYPHQGWILPSMPRRVAETAGWAIPPSEAIHLHWYGKPFERISYHELYLESQKSKPSRLPELAGKIVIIGAAAPGLHDLRPTPLGAATPGPEILATAIANLRDRDWLTPVASHWNILFGLLGVAALSFIFKRRPNPVPVAGGLAVFSLATAGVAYALLGVNLAWTPFSPLTATWLTFAIAATASYIRERRQRDHAVQMFSRFLDPNVVRSLTDQEGDLAKAETGTGREITILFSDIRGFTTLSESRTPEEIVTLLNRYFDLQVAAIFEQGGTLDKFIGDAIMAFWNAPVSVPDHAIRAVRAALGMSTALEGFKKELGELGEHFDIGIGIHTGSAVVGFLGSSQRLDYTAIGDSVNVASRIEGQTKGVARILVSEATRQACGNVFKFIDHGEVTVKGRSQPVRLYEPREHA
ncbi:MAG: adenylate/guanylate cyclase domain-containing protein [Azonexus sp.]|nr:adenylate/guanylate cyclase domain-containing protein [Azonexus sp.]